MYNGVEFLTCSLLTAVMIIGYQADKRIREKRKREKEQYYERITRIERDYQARILKKYLEETEMTDAEKKKQVLCSIAKALNDAHITWAVGGSLLLYFKGITDTFHDLDLMIAESDIEEAKRILCRRGSLQPQYDNGQYQTRHFLEFVIDAVDVDVISGFVIVKGGVAYECPLEISEIQTDFYLNGIQIPLHDLKTWERYYQLMGRTEKVRMIADFFSSEKKIAAN